MSNTNLRDTKTKFKSGEIALAIFLVIALFSISFFAGTRIYKYNMKPDGQIASSDMNIREGKVHQVTASDVDSKNNLDFNPYKHDGKKIAYLTFDDGPSTTNTPKILKILKENNIHATFFVIGNLAEENKALVKLEHANGNAIGNHTYSHVYNKIYANPIAFLDEIKENENVIKSILGDSYKSKLIRFPGGSFGRKLKPFRDEMVKDGYHFVDWNALDGDAEGTNIAPPKLFIRLKETVATQSHVVILMHDAYAKNTTVEILPQIIQYLKVQGYTFDTLK